MLLFISQALEMGQDIYWEDDKFPESRKLLLYLQLPVHATSLADVSKSVPSTADEGSSAH